MLTSRLAPALLRVSLLVGFALASSTCRDKQSLPASAPPVVSPSPPGQSPPAQSPPDGPPRGPLGDDVAPTRYALALNVRPDAPRFSGTVRIDITLRRALPVLWMHGRNLTVRKVTLERAGASAIAAKWKLVDAEGVAQVAFDAPAPPGAATLVLEYDGEWNRNLRGLYRATENGAAYAFTQFEPMSARYAFPSFDDPRFKTPFDIVLTVPRGNVAISNSPEKSRALAGPDADRVTFATSAPLPTYLVAMAVGPFDVVEGPPVPPTASRKTPLPLRGIATRGKGKQLDYALQRTGGLVRVLEDYFGVAYPYAKLDLIAVPEFSAGAMENAGAITFREVLLLIDGARASLEVRRTFAGVMAHELAHQWFGDLVTLRWWDDAWLNEGFASWMTLRALGLWRPDYRSDLRESGAAASVMRSDSLASARQVRQPILTHHDVRNAFDDITYRKGAAVLGMFERWIGAEPFRQGIRRYLERHRFGSATSEDFLAALSEGAGRDVRAAFRTFLEQPGLPLVQVEPLCEKGSTQPARVRLTQERYRPIGSTASTTGLWHIPVCMRYAPEETNAAVDGARTHCVLVDQRQTEAPLPGTRGCPAWLHPNADGTGYYRFVLPAGGLAALRAASASLTARERFSIADNLVAGVMAKRVRFADAFPELSTFAQSTESLVAKAPMALLEAAHDHLAPAELRPRVEASARALYHPVLTRLGGLADALAGKGLEKDLDARSLRQEVVEFLAETGHDPEVRAALAKAGAQVLFGNTAPPIAPDLMQTAIGVALEEGDAKLFDRALTLLRANPAPMMRKYLVRGLTGLARGPLAQRARDLLLDPTALRTNELVYGPRPQFGRAESRAAAWDWVRANYDALMKRLPAGHAPYLIKALGTFCDEARAQEVSAFFAPRVEKLSGGPLNLRSALEAIRLCVARVEALGPDVRAHFSTR